MAKFLFKTKGNADPSGKRKVYFTCHPEDFARCFDKVCEDIFRTHDCVIYYTEDMKEIIAEEDKATDLGQMNFFVVPVTFKLLSKPNRAMDSDIAYAKREHIPILPLMMETGIDEFYGKPDKFGELQYLNPYSNDISEIGYAEKMKKYLESVLISDEMAQRIRKAFDTYIFLSYRKKDRRYANELMKMIHDIPEYRDIAIWYDEFLTPGESFRQNIEKALQESKLFALLVTPNLLEDNNFVMTEEYPTAKRSDMTILPTEMVATDKIELQKKYEDIPECADPKAAEGFKKRFLDALEKAAISKAEHDPAHNFLIGLAYLDGIDMEIDRERGLKLITDAAKDGLIDAMEMLFKMYREGKGIQVNYKEAVKWGERIAEYYREHYGEEETITLTSMAELASTYDELGYYHKSIDLKEKVCALSCKILGENDRNTMISLNNLAVTYNLLGNLQKSLELKEKVYDFHCKTFGAYHPDTLTSLNSLSYSYVMIGNYKKGMELNEKAYSGLYKIFGGEHFVTLNSLNNLAASYYELGNYPKAIDLTEYVYKKLCKIFGEEHPATITSLNNLAVIYNEHGDPEKALELNEKSYLLHCKILGEKHPSTLRSLDNLADVYGTTNNHLLSLELHEKAYVLFCEVMGEENRLSLKALGNLAHTYGKIGEHQKALKLQEKVYALCCRTLGEKHPDTLTALNNLATTCENIGNYPRSFELYEQSYTLHANILGEQHPHTIKSLTNLIQICKKLGKSKKVMILSQKLRTKTKPCSQKRKSSKK